jgi:hypothetical protein
MDFLAFASFAVLVVAWIFAPSKGIAIESASEERAAA